MAMALSWRRISNKHIGFCGCNELFSTNALCQLQRQTQILSKYIPNFFFFSRVCKVLYLLKQFDGMAMAKGKSKCGRRKKNEKTAKQTAFKTLPCRLIKSVSLRP